MSVGTWVVHLVMQLGFGWADKLAVHLEHSSVESKVEWRENCLAVATVVYLESWLVD
jgi:hypothetical protein